MTTATEIKEHPILFKGDMVRAILDGRKTQTRRVIKPQPPKGLYPEHCHWSKTGWALSDITDDGTLGGCHCGDTVRCPYGIPGDRLWVRETWKTCNEGGYVPGVVYADGKQKYPEFEELDKMPKDWQNFKRNRPSIYMPRWASRIDLLVKNIRVERVQDITEEDAGSEGIPRLDDRNSYFIEGFHSLWDSINAKRGFGWDVNPWVWVVEFEKVQA